ncbi:hypothetical protein SBRCBS47491_000699 [Sporothrix bragantina]|uniref:Uncharacterized protein n=1 Tax=Sporothrix bragantina TaxID=671064 RepID=A0ABP0ASS4_9PEZI
MAYVRAWTVTEIVPLRCAMSGLSMSPTWQSRMQPYSCPAGGGTCRQRQQLPKPPSPRLWTLSAPLRPPSGKDNNSAVSSVGVSCCEAQGWSLARTMLPDLQDVINDSSLCVITTHAYKGSPGAPDTPLNTSMPV